ncbi:fungal pheromone STE3G-protein-coupled receptor [Armillaria solidipes]|uniref:Fungal pheromone STE3G-protein-coupled receptor n=1 Tax=Armillaria solidipes TaxID=1076256 RepID=A0A2H3BMV1_9AGAR|nr:fungal pheromone STE3G-protein-coupled receptor [Armillaria solidipes]
MYAELPAMSFISALLVLVPLPWHWRAGTIPTIAITFWLFLGNLINGVNAVVWSDNVRIVSPVWCDIATKLMIGMNISLPCSLLCLCMHLERVSSMRMVQTTVADKRRRQAWDSFLCFFVPVIYMALHYIVQGHRFDIIEHFGCRPAIYNSLASLFLIWIPPLLFSIGAGIFSAVALHHFFVRRITFARHLQTKNSALTASHYFRLMSMSLVQIFWGVLVTGVNMWFTMKNGLRPWTGWADIHVGFSRIGQFPQLLISPTTWSYTYGLWWTIPISSILFFAFFSFGQEAMKQYHSCFRWVKTAVLRMPESNKFPSAMDKLGSLPS